MKDIVSVIDLSPEQLEAILSESVVMKDRYRQGVFDPLYQGKTLGMYFEKPSLRTRVSLQSAMASMGGVSIYLESDRNGELWERESVKDQARVMSRVVHLVAMRTYSQDVIEEFAREATIPVLNVLSDWEHPTQAIADYMTMGEHFGNVKGRTMVYVGDGNNVARSLLSAAAYLGVRFVWTGPEGYRIDREYVDRVRAKVPGVEFVEEIDPHKAVKEADVIYTDVWASMGQEDEAEMREKEFAAYQINDKLMRSAPDTAIAMHCLPAHRGMEITDDVIDGPRSTVYEESENRMHVYRGIFSLLAGDWRK